MRKRAESGGRIPLLQGEISVLRNTIKGFRERKAQLYDLLAEQELTREEFQKKQKALSRQQRAAEQQCEKQQEELSCLERMVYTDQIQEKELKYYLNMENLTREMVEALIDCIYVYQDKSIHIQWKFTDGKNNSREGIS